MTAFDPRTVQPTHPHYAGQFTAPHQFGAPTYPGRPYPGAAVPPPSLSKPPRKGRPLAAKIVAGFVAAGIVAGGAGAWLAFSGPSAEAAVVQSTSFAGANPTTVPFGTDAPQVAAVAATGPQSGDTTGLYAATTPPACTTADFLSQLQADPSKLAAFGGVYGLGSSDVPAFVDSLAPVVLRANTSVTDHPYVDGAFAEQPAVLAAGTAVLVNSYGEPTVKCYNGNPLTAGATADDAVTVIPTTQVITQYSFTSIDNSRVVIIAGKPDPKPNPGPNPTTTPQPDPALVKAAQDAKATAEKARTDATTARERAAGFAAVAQQAQTNLTGLQNDLDRAIAEGANPQVIASLTKARDDAAADLETKKNQAKFADAAATSAEGTATQAEKNAKDAQDKADASAKTPAEEEDKDKPADAKKADDQTATTGTEGQATGTEPKTDPVKVQKPATLVQTCPAVVTEATATPTCPVTASADAAQKAPAAKGTTTTDTEKTTTDSTEKGSSAKDSGSSSSSSSSTSSTKGGSDK